MSLNLDAGAFVVSGTIATPSAGTTVLLNNTPCDLDVSGIQLYAGTVGSTASSFNIKVTPPTAAPLYARTYNYNYATAKNINVSSIATDGSALTFTVSGSATVATGDVISVNGSTLPAWNLKDAVVTGVTTSGGLTTAFTVAYPEPVGTSTHLTGWSGIATVSASNVVVGASTIKFITDAPHGLKTGDKVTVTGVTTVTAANVTGATVTVVDSTSFTVAVTTTGTPGGTAKILATVVGTKDYPIVVTKGKVVEAVQLVTDAVDYNRDPNYAQGTPFYAYISDQILAANARGVQLPAATALGNADGRVAGRIPAGSKIELEVLVRGTSLADLAYGVEFKKK